MLFFNISSDQIAIQGKDLNLLVPYDDLERTLPQIVGDLYDKHPFKEVWVLNGPWGFSLLRIGCLVLNTMQMATEGKLRLLSCTKLDLYGALIKKWLVPSTGIIFIGQRKNVRWATFDVQTWTRDTQTLPANSIDHMTKSGEYFVDVMYDHPLKELVDQERMISFLFDWDFLQVARKDKVMQIDTKELELKPNSYLQPDYMMQPEVNM